MSNSDKIVKVENFSYVFEGRDEPTLRDISFEIERGSLCVIVGPSGCGKTTLCDAISGIVPHVYGGRATGRVIVDGLEVSANPITLLSEKAGKVFQDPEIMFTMMDAEAELAFGPENLRREPQSIIKGIDEVLDYIDLASHRESLVWQMSGGQMQKLGLGCILMMKTPIIVLDEPTSNLDPLATESVHSLVLRLRAEGSTVILVTKELDEFVAQADQLLVLNEGRLESDGPPRSVIMEHGQYLMDNLGIWLPEVSELGVLLAGEGVIRTADIPLTVQEAADVVHSIDIRFNGIGPKQGCRSESTENGLAKPETLVSGRDIFFEYPGGHQALKGVSFDVRRGDLLAIIGRNGAGKTTLAKMLVGLLQPTSGDLTILGRRAEKWKLKNLVRHVGLVFQNPEHQFLTDSVFDEVAYTFLAQGTAGPDEVEERVNEILDALDLQDVARDHPFALSAGKKRRLGVGTMLGANPEILIVDEPTYGQDKAMTRSLIDLLKRLQAQGTTLVMITHDMRLVEESADRVIVMNRGHITYDGPPKDLFHRLELLHEASLKPTALQKLLSELARDGHRLPPDLKSVEDLVGAIDAARLRKD